MHVYIGFRPLVFRPLFSSFSVMQHSCKILNSLIFLTNFIVLIYSIFLFSLFSKFVKDWFLFAKVVWNLKNSLCYVIPRIQFVNCTYATGLERRHAFNLRSVAGGENIFTVQKLCQQQFPTILKLTKRDCSLTMVLNLHFENLNLKIYWESKSIFSCAIKKRKFLKLSTLNWF